MINDDAIISVQHVTFGYKRREPVLQDIDLDVPQGQSLGILGYNGVGKTTLLNLHDRTAAPATGAVHHQCRTRTFHA